MKVVDAALFPPTVTVDLAAPFIKPVPVTTAVSPEIMAPGSTLVTVGNVLST